MADAPAHFKDLGLSAPVQRALEDVGYESPSPIQAGTIPPMLAGRDVVGQAQTGTGKTAAFALPILSNIDLTGRAPQALVLAPTRELAIQVAEAFQRYAAHLPGFHVLPIYGGQSYEPQLKSLRRGVHVVVGTPGRVLDHLRRGTLKLGTLRWLVLDEADEMLRMGFIDDVEEILKATPPARQVALFSATMPAPIRRIAAAHLKSPAEVTIRSATTTVAAVRQRYVVVGGMSQKLEALTRILETETFDAMLVFARTKQATSELAEKLSARGLQVAALNGDIAQAQRERVVAQLKSGRIDIVVATDVAARGLDVERISHVINYDAPYDNESYVHRIGRTGRAGRSGEAILFIAPRERGLLASIERATRQKIEPMETPTASAVNAQRTKKFRQKITDALGQGQLEPYLALVQDYSAEHGIEMPAIAAALARIAQGETGSLTARRAEPEPARERAETPRHERPQHARPQHDKPRRDDAPREGKPVRGPRKASDDLPMEMYRIEVGLDHGAKAANIVGAIANEAGLDAEYIGRVDIRDDHSLVELPQGMPKDVARDLAKAWVCGRQLQLSKSLEGGPKTPYSAPVQGRKPPPHKPPHRHHKPR